MLMHTDDRTVEKNFFKICVFGQLGKDPLPDLAAFPPCKPLVDAVPQTELFRQVAPGRSRPCHPQDGVDEQTIVGGGPSAVAWFAREQVLNPIPLIVTQVQAGHLYDPIG
jgi:hypothetical protein